MKVDTKFAILDAGYLTLDSIDVLLENKISFYQGSRKTGHYTSRLLKII